MFINKNRLKLLLAGCLTTGTISGCSSMKIEDFSQSDRDFDLFAYFDGDTRAWGIFEDRFGTLRRQFTVDIKGEIDGNVLTLTEDFVYTDGEISQRIWVITDRGNGRFTGKAEDILGEATGTASGNALNWQYDMALEVNGSQWRVHFDDWMFLQDNDVLINRARVTKWGLEIGEVSLFFQPATSEPDGE